MRILFGSQNYGYDVEKSDKDWLEIVYPSWDDIYSNKKISSERKSGGAVIKTKDIRCLREMVYSPNLSMSQFLFPQYTEDCDDLQWVFDNANRLIRVNLHRLYSSTKGIVECELDREKLTAKGLTRNEAYIRILAKILNNTEIDSFVDTSLRDFRVQLQTVESCDSILRKVALQQRTRLRELEKWYLAFRGKVDTNTLNDLQSEIIRLLRERMV